MAFPTKLGTHKTADGQASPAHAALLMDLVAAPQPSVATEDASPASLTPSKKRCRSNRHVLALLHFCYAATRIRPAEGPARSGVMVRLDPSRRNAPTRAYPVRAGRFHGLWRCNYVTCDRHNSVSRACHDAGASRGPKKRCLR